MDKFVKRALHKIDQLDCRQIVQVIERESAVIDKFEQVLDSLPQGVVLCDANGRIQYINRTARLLSPFKRLKSYDGYAVSYVLNDTALRNYLMDCFRGKDENTGEFAYQWGPETKTLRVNVTPMEQDDSAAPSAFLVVFTDATQEKRDESRLRRSESLASMTTMAAGVAHEIKNPLAAIGIHLQLLTKAFERKGTLTLDDASRYINVIDEEIQRLNSIVVDFLFAVRPMDSTLRLTALPPLLTEICDFVEPELKENHVSLVRSFASVPRLMIDSNLLKQALLNIIKNGMMAMEETPEGIMTIACKLDGNFVDILISDNGKGMDEKTLAKIFEPYFTTKASGTGLGLTVVYKIFKEHNGDVQVHSILGKGTTFTMKLPVPHGQRLALGEVYHAEVSEAGKEQEK
ncbi:MAG: ATP-binding protein [Spirochaetia bacterium]|nr:ATP-binding protein [Spirochaetia bacterium]